MTRTITPREERIMRRKAQRLPLVEDSEWVWQYDAGRELGFTRYPGRVVFALMHGYLDAVRNSAGLPGVSRTSLEREKEWRRTASIRARIWRVIKYIVNWL